MTSLQPSPNTHSPMRLWVRLWVLGLAVALLLSQSLGQLHAVKHGGLTGTNHVARVIAAHDHVDFFDQLFSSHSSNKDCRLFDQLSAGDAMPAVAAALMPVVLPSLVVAIFQGAALARWAALFDARGPPSTF